MKEDKKTTTILIDIGGVMVDDRPYLKFNYQALFEALRDLGYCDNEKEYYKLLNEFRKTTMPSASGAVIENFSSTPKDILKVKEKWLKRELALPYEKLRNLNPIRKGAAEAIEKLSHKYRLATASNHEPRARNMLQDYGLLKYFSYLGISSLIGLRKPDLKFFRHIIEKLGCAPEETLMVGDRLGADIIPAKKLGLKTCWIEFSDFPSQDELNKITNMIDYTLYSLSELPKLLEI